MNETVEKFTTTVKAWCGSMDRQDTVFILSTLTTLVVWWIVLGRRKYSTKGMR